MLRAAAGHRSSGTSPATRPLRASRGRGRTTNDRGHRTKTGPAAWDEFIDTLVDFRVPVDPAETPRTAAERVASSLIPARRVRRQTSACSARPRNGPGTPGVPGHSQSLQAVVRGIRRALAAPGVATHEAACGTPAAVGHHPVERGRDDRGQSLSARSGGARYRGRSATLSAAAPVSHARPLAGSRRRVVPSTDGSAQAPAGLSRVHRAPVRRRRRPRRRLSDCPPGARASALRADR